MGQSNDDEEKRCGRVCLRAGEVQKKESENWKRKAAKVAKVAKEQHPGFQRGPPP